MENTIETINNIVNEDTVNIAAEAVEAIPAKAINLRKLGKVGGVVGAVVAIGVGTVALVRHAKRKQQLKTEQENAAETGVDNVQVAKDDFEEETEISADEK